MSFKDEQNRKDAEYSCVPCLLCGGKAVISDAGPGAGYYVWCENADNGMFGKTKIETGCNCGSVRVGGHAKNAPALWNRNHRVKAA